MGLQITALHAANFKIGFVYYYEIQMKLSIQIQ